MATTTNFGWETPDDTDLVKDGAAAIRTLGSAIDTSLVDLKGGTTGQVLSKTSNTDMDFTWVTSDDANAIQNAIVDAKGDLIAASAADTPARLAVGNNGETLVADSSTSTGLRWQNFKTVNYLLNSDCSIWQRGTSFSTNGTYGLDRWVVTGSSTNFTTSQVTSSLPEGFRYAVKLQRNSGATATSIVSIAQALETTQTIPLQGKKIALSFWAKKGADFSGASSQMIIRIYTGTGTDQTGTTFGTWTGYSEINATSQIITSSWVRYTATATVGTTATQIGVRLGFTPVGTAGADDSMQITGIQLEVGEVATSFQTATGTLAGELAACQRYYATSLGNGDAGIWDSSTEVWFGCRHPVSMRTTPSVTLLVTALSGRYNGNVTSTSSTISYSELDANGASLKITGWTGGSTNAICILRTNNAAAFSAEL